MKCGSDGVGRNVLPPTHLERTNTTDRIVGDHDSNSELVDDPKELNPVACIARTLLLTLTIHLPLSLARDQALILVITLLMALTTIVIQPHKDIEETNDRDRGRSPVHNAHSTVNDAVRQKDTNKASDVVNGSPGGSRFGYAADSRPNGHLSALQT